VCIGGMGGDEVDGAVWDDIKRAGIPDVCSYVGFAVFFIKGRVGEVQPVAGDHDGIGIYVNPDGVALEESALDEGGAAACHLVKDGVITVCVAEDKVAGDVG